MEMIVEAWMVQGLDGRLVTVSPGFAKSSGKIGHRNQLNVCCKRD